MFYDAIYSNEDGVECNARVWVAMGKSDKEIDSELARNAPRGYCLLWSEVSKNQGD